MTTTDDIHMIDGVAETESDEPANTAPPRRRRRKSTAYWMRVIHVYSSVICLLVVLFFATTGVTLNHPGWTFGLDGKETTLEGTLPASFSTADGIDFLVVAEHVRVEHGVKGFVDDHRADDREGRVSFKGPGYDADVQFGVIDGNYELTVYEEGLIGVLNDVHKGRGTNSAWARVIDVTGLGLILVAVSGLGIQVLTAKRRRLALSLAGIGSIAAVVAIAATLA